MVSFPSSFISSEHWHFQIRQPIMMLPPKLFCPFKKLTFTNFKLIEYFFVEMGVVLMLSWMFMIKWPVITNMGHCWHFSHWLTKIKWPCVFCSLFCGILSLFHEFDSITEHVDNMMSLRECAKFNRKKSQLFQLLEKRSHIWAIYTKLSKWSVDLQIRGSCRYMYHWHAKRSVLECPRF